MRVACVNRWLPWLGPLAGKTRDALIWCRDLVVKIGEGDVILSGSNLYHGVTEIREGALVVHNHGALGDPSPTANTIVDAGTSLELATDLARLWCAGSRPEDARRILSPVVDTFTEGFATHDLRAAARLLAACLRPALTCPP